MPLSSIEHTRLVWTGGCDETVSAESRVACLSCLWVARSGRGTSLRSRTCATPQEGGASEEACVVLAAHVVLG